MATTLSSPPTLTIPGPKPLPIVGRTLNSIRFAQDSVGYTRELFHTYGNLVALTAGGGTRLYSPRDTCPGTVFACGPDLVRQVTTQHEVYFKYPLTGTLYRLRGKSPRTEPLRGYLESIN